MLTSIILYWLGIESGNVYYSSINKPFVIKGLNLLEGYCGLLAFGLSFICQTFNLKEHLSYKWAYCYVVTSLMVSL
jgi:fluoride ion exporter CrcB/FEX